MVYVGITANASLAVGKTGGGPSGIVVHVSLKVGANGSIKVAVKEGGKPGACRNVARLLSISIDTILTSLDENL